MLIIRAHTNTIDRKETNWEQKQRKPLIANKR